MMATTAPLKRETLKNIGNVPDYLLKQRNSKDSKKESGKVVRSRPTTKQPKASSKPSVVVAPVAPVIAKQLVIPQPIKEEVKNIQENAAQKPSGSKVKRVYTRDFLMKFKSVAPSFPPGTLTPLDLIAQYNKEFELKERLASQDNSSLTPVKPISTPAPTIPSQPSSASTESHARAPVGERKLKKKGEKVEGAKRGEKTPFKLHLGTTDESILRSPLFRATATKTPARNIIPASSAKVEDKENSGTTVKTARSTSITKTRAPSPLVKEPIRTTKLAPAPSAPIITVPVPVSMPTPVAVTVPTVPRALPATMATPAAVVESTATLAQPATDVAMDDAKDDLDVLAKKLKSVLKETDPRRLAQRQKQIDYGKATAGYQDYSQQTAKSKRKREDPKTPNKYQVCSKRSWDGQVRKWRRMLHMYDPADLKDQAKDDLERNFEITEADLLAEENALRE